MSRRDLIFDWTKPESRRRDKLYAILVVSLLATAFAGLVDLRIPAFPHGSARDADVIRFADPGMAGYWLREAEENGPFPGRLNVDEGLSLAVLPEVGSLDHWANYKVILRPLPGGTAPPRMEITAKGKRVFPALPAVRSDSPSGAAPRGEMRRIPILNPYDRIALDWMPEEVPDLVLPAGADVSADSLRFALSLRDDGGVSEVIPLAAGSDPVQEAVSGWLRGVRFKEGNGGQWLGLRVDFANGREDVAEPE